MKSRGKGRRGQKIKTEGATRIADIDTKKQMVEE